MSDHWYAIVNPASGSGRTAAYWEKISGYLRHEGIVYEPHFTQSKGHATELAMQGISRGFTKIIAVGGDGTAHEVANGILKQEKVPSLEITLAMIPAGTGNDWGRTIGIPRNWNAAIRAIRAGKKTVQDIGVIEYGQVGNENRRYFINIAGMGFEAYVGEYINARKARGKGGLYSYVKGLIVCLGSYKTQETVYVVGNDEFRAPVFSLACGICKYNGGGMKQCPDAEPDDGLLDLTVIHSVSKWTVIRNIGRIFSGSFVKLRQVRQFRGISFTAFGEKEALPIDADGESLGSGKANFSILPRALHVICR